MKKIKIGEKGIRFLNRFSLFFHAVGSLVLYFLIELVSRHSFTEAWNYMTEKPLVFLYNALLIFTTTTIVYLFRRRTVMRVLVFGLWGILGIINGVVLANRVTPFTGPDLKLMDDLQKIIGGYVSIPLLILALAAAVAAVIFLVIFWIRGPKYKGKRNWVVDILIPVLSIALLLGSTGLAISKRVLSTYFGNIAFAYQDYGFPYCLTVTIFDTGISKPNKYTEGFIGSLTAETEDEDPKADVNIIFLQLESFFDPQTVNFLNISEDPIPYFHQLMKEYSSGYYRVPSVGAGTANTEFESISGMSLRYFGPGEYPYKTVLKETTCESIPYDLKNHYGYATHAIHNNEASFYGRNVVYPMLGFESFTSEEYMEDVSDVTETGWVKDHILTREILNCMSSSVRPDYIYTVSVQGHGDYPTDAVVADPQIRVTGAEDREKNNNSWEYYCKQIHEMDQFLVELTDALSQYPEKVVLVMYGDHLPTMGLQTPDMDNHYLFQTQYVMWDNFGLKKEDKNLCTYQMGAEVMNRLGMHKGTLVNFHQSRQGTKNYQKDLEILQYDLLYGEQYALKGQDPLDPVPMKMGVLPITLRNIYATGDGMMVLEGDHLTAASAVEVNGKVPEQKRMLFAGLLIVSDVELNDGDELAIVQLDSSSREVLSRTESLIYREEPVPEGEGETEISKSERERALLERILQGKRSNQ